ncbi:hypothetical protein ABH973_002381 [Bradyrhizobium ottawaense]|uniref:hypothetical protein n=1 Tax=Bradyrhizobium ottawaense TaxID=931866 RepID=UPI001BADB8C6|nr:hypothetical protein [Bradyrhizobium diazoefficiens]MBR0925182.1 hypothetical protein [Bradyrhizobium diazoefficiens]
MPKIHGIESAGLTKAQADQIATSVDDFDLLRAFCRRVDRLEQSGFSKRFETDVPNVIAKMNEPSFQREEGLRFSIVARVESWVEDFSQDEIDAFVLSYRVFTQDNDRFSIRNLSKIFAKDWMHPNARECFEDARAQLNGHLDSASTISFPEGRISVRALVDTIIYGGLAHSNEEKSKIFDSWEHSGIMGFIWAEFMAYAREVVDTLKYMRGLILDLIASIEEHGLTVSVAEGE